MTKNNQQSYVQLLNSLRDELRGKFDQKPQLSASHREYLQNIPGQGRDWTLQGERSGS